MAFRYLYPEAMGKQRAAIYDSYLAKQGKRLNDAELEMACFNAIPFGHPLKGEFCISLALMRWDFLYVEKDGIENTWFTRMLRGMCKHRKLFLVGSASAGKSMSMAVAGMNFWGTSPWNTTFLVTSTDKESLDAKIWGAIKDLHEKDKFGIGVRINYEDAIVLENSAKKRDIRDAIKAIALPKGSEGEKAIGKVQGRKNTNIIWASDEFAHMDPFVQQARANLMAAPFFCFWAASNKPEEGDPMYQDAMPDPVEFPLGWETPGLSDRTGWKTQGGGYCLYFDGEKSPNTKAEAGKPDPFPMLTRRDYIEAIRRDEGEDGYGWWRYIRAFPKAGETHDRVINSRMLERYGALEAPIWSGSGWVTVAGLDPSWTKGGDDCMADFGRVGMDVSGKKVLAHEVDAVKLNAKMSGKGTFEEQVSEAFIQECRKRDCHCVAIDISGGGGRVAMEVRNAADRLHWKLEIINVDAAGRPSDTELYEVGDERKVATELFDRKVSELIISYRLSIQAGLIRGANLTSRAIKELCDRRSTNDERKRLCVEKKADVKKRNNGKSPDAGESRILTHVAARAHGLGAVSPSVKKAVSMPLSESPGKSAPARYSYGHSPRKRYA